MPNVTLEIAKKLKEEGMDKKTIKEMTGLLYTRDKEALNPLTKVVFKSHPGDLVEHGT